MSGYNPCTYSNPEQTHNSKHAKCGKWIYIHRKTYDLFYSSNTLHLSTQNFGLRTFPPEPLVTTGLSENGTVSSFSGNLWVMFSYKKSSA